MIFLTGHHSSGKSTLANKLKSEGFIHIETGKIVRQKYLELTRGEKNFQVWATQIHKNSPARNS